MCAKKIKDRTGIRYGELTALAFAGKARDSGSLWLCECDCGKKKVIHGGSLASGDTVSCGCLRARAARAAQTTHGKSYSREYSSWMGMLSRCRNPKNIGFRDYGGAGIQVCNRWLRFENFYRDMGDRPPGTTIERKDGRKGYNPKNCKWATATEQGRNRRTNRILTIGRESKCLAEWSEISGISWETIKQRIKAGMPEKDAVFLPVRRYSRA